MAWIDGTQGIFRLYSSNEFCGSKISLTDAAEIFGVAAADIVDLAGKGVSILEEDGEQFVNELDLHKAWGQGIIPTEHPSRIGSAKRSFDELILMKLVEIALPACTIEPQVKAGRKQVDMVVSYGGKDIGIEFFGPSHFIPQYGRTPDVPSDRITAIESKLGIECVIWPYWIQRCEANVRVLFDSDKEGRAAVWSTKAHFEDFTLGGAATLITELSKRFNALPNSGLGYMYTNERTKNKPVHPIIDRILKGKEQRSRLIPKDNHFGESFWLPSPLVQKIEE